MKFKYCAKRDFFARYFFKWEGDYRFRTSRDKDMTVEWALSGTN
jgi:hypothetical protein